MKRTLFVLVFVFMALGVSAQVDTFSVGDMPRNYYIEDWPDYDFFRSQRDTIDGAVTRLVEHPGAAVCLYRHPSDPYYSINMDFAYDFLQVVYNPNFNEWNLWGRDHVHNFAVGKHADGPIRIAGVGLFYPHYTNELGEDGLRMRDALLANDMDYLILQLMDTAMNVLAEGSTMLTDSVGKPVFVINRNSSYNEIYPWIGSEYSHVHDIYEVFFDTAVTVTDSFYLAVHLESMAHEGDGYGISVPGIYEYHVTESLNPAVYDYTFPNVYWRAQGGFRYNLSIENHIAVPDDEWFTEVPCWEHHGEMLIFPILEIDCPKPEEVVWFPLGNNDVMLRWEQGEWTTGWEVSYGPLGTLPDDGTVVETTSPSVIIDGLAEDVQYVAYIRSRCTVRDTTWSEWSDSVVIAMQGIDAVGEGRSVELHPNPAGGEVALTAEAELKSVEVYTSTGARYTTLPAAGRTVRFDTSAWPVGTYLLVVGTDRGTVTRRLSVAR